MYEVSTLPVVDGPAKFAVADVASGELFPVSWLGDETGRFVAIRWSEGHLDAARAVLAAIVATAGPAAELHGGVDVEVHAHLPERKALFEEFGFAVWQEKEGFWWTDKGQDLPPVAGVTVRTLAEIGRDRYVDVIESCTVGTLDRIDRDAIASMGNRGWARAFVDGTADPDTDDIWYVIEDSAGDGVGFVALGPFDEEGVGTVLHIGVAAAHRGHGYVDQLMRLANRTARERGWTHVLSDVDVLNPPMMAAMERAGHHAADRPWHKWYYRRPGV